MLSAKLAAPFQPVREAAAAHGPDLRSEHGQIAAAVRPIILIDPAQGAVQFSAESAHIIRYRGELDQVAMPARNADTIWKHGSDVKVHDFGSGGCSGRGHCLLDLLTN